MNSSTNVQQLLRNPDIAPTSEVIAAGLGAANSAYARFIEGLSDHDINLEWRYYADGKAWLAKGQHIWIGVRGGQKEVTAFWLSIWEGFFKAVIYIPEKARMDALQLPLNEEVRQMIADAKQMGKLKFFQLIFDLCSEEMFDAVYALIDFRKNIR